MGKIYITVVVLVTLIVMLDTNCVVFAQSSTNHQSPTSTTQPGIQSFVSLNTSSTTITVTNENNNQPTSSTISSTAIIPKCASLTELDHGSVTIDANTSTHHSIATYQCNEGYYLNGSNTSLCQDGAWSGDVERKCVLKDCGNLTYPDNGNVTTENDSTKYRSVATYMCNVGYKFNISNIRQCQANGKWNGTEPSCILINCGNLTYPDNGKVTTENDSTTYRSVATYMCNVGYKLNTSNIRQCQANSKWNGTEPSCTLIMQNYDQPCTNGLTDNQCTTHGAKCTMETDGYRCRCGEDHFYFVTNNSCLPMQNYDQPCTNGLTDNQCTTHGAKCTMETDGYRCRCGEDHFYFVTNNSCLPKIAYQGTCNATDQCETVNATCKEETCTCGNEMVYLNTACILKVPPIITFFERSTRTITMNITKGNEMTTVFNVCGNASIPDNCRHTNKTGVQITVQYTYNRLQSGTCYSFTATAMNDDVVRESSTVSIYCTSPQKPLVINTVTDKIFTRNVSVVWNWNGENNKNCTSVNFISTDVTSSSFLPITVQRYDGKNFKCYAMISHLKPSMTYNISIHTEANGLSSEPGFVTITTTYEAPSNCSIVTQTSTSITLYWMNGGGKFDSIRITHNNSKMMVGKSLDIQVISDFSPGTYYCFSLKSYRDEDQSLSATSCDVCAYTLPAAPVNLEFNKAMIFSNSFQASWKPGEQNLQDLFFYVYLQTAYNVSDESIEISYTQLKTFDNLDAGAQYKVTVVAAKNVTVGGNNEIIKSNQNLTGEINTRPIAPYNCSISNVTNTSLTVTWYADSTNIFDNYSMDIYPEGEMDDTQTLSFHKKNYMEHTFHLLISGTNYIIEIYTVYGGLRSENSTETSSFTVPSLPANIFVTERTDNEFTLTYNDTKHRFLHWIINVTSDNINYRYKSISKNNVSATIDSLKSGTNYSVDVYTKVPNFRSIDTFHMSIWTRPSTPSFLSIPVREVHERDFTVHVNTSDDRFDVYFLSICTSVDTENCLSNATIGKYNTSAVVANLEAATNYTVNVYTIITPPEGPSLLSPEPAVATSYTSSKRPNVTIGQVTNTSIVLDLNGNDLVTFDHYTVIRLNVSDSTQTNTTISNDDANFTIVNLTPGSVFTFHIYTLLFGIPSEQFYEISSPTEPNPVGTVQLTDYTQATLTITWEPPHLGNVENYIVNFTCVSPNQHSDMTENQSYITTNKTATATGLDPGSFCNVNVTPQFKHLTGQPKRASDISIEEGVPNPVRDLQMVAITSTSLTVTWTRPKIRNGIIRHYFVRITDEDNKCMQEIFLTCLESCNTSEVPKPTPPPGGKNCDFNQTKGNFTKGQENLIHSVDSLHPFRNYTANVIAFTVDSGKETNTTGQTLEDIPGIPKGEEISLYTHNTATLKWNAPEDRNGIITGYTIRYSFKEKLCQDGVTVEGEEKTRVKDVYPEIFPLTELTVSDSIYPFWNYSFTVTANTTVGEGRPYQFNTIQTKESKPSKIDPVTITNVTAYAANISWQPPCFPNGIVIRYNVCFTNISTHANQSDTCYNYSSAIMDASENVLPYRNYKVKVAAETSAGQGNFSNETDIKTPIAAPAKPQELHASSTATDITVRWIKPAIEMFTGPTKYRVIAMDTLNSSVYTCETNIATWIDSLSSSCIVRKLHPYTNYTLNVTAITGTFMTSSTYNMVQTNESTPGDVTGLLIKAESNVTKPRTILVSWGEPAYRERHGIITDYFVQYTDVNGVSLRSRTDNKVTKLLITAIQPGNYSIKVFAATRIGNGTEVSNSTTVDPGAPIKIVESSDTLLIQPASTSVSDDQKQIAIKLPLTQFLCNSSNGEPTKWGVIVSQENEATDPSFVGSLSEFQTKIKPQYKNWFDVKDSDSIKPYIATGEDWKPNCPGQNGGRRRRSADAASTEDYEIGSEGDCSGKPPNEYCNGELQPGRKYKVKTFACTSGGCTETEYSEPIKTKPNLTPIIAGLVSGLIVVLAVGGVLFFMRRRQAGCFAKGDDDFETTHRSGHSMDTEMKDTITTSKQPNGFVPRQIKLADFPPFVETLKNDSGLLFADAYKMLKENSPAHPTTAAEQQTCRPKNRYTNILAFDHSRVKLLPMDDEEGSDYINANYIPGYTSPREYIATQGPIIATLDDFWRMVWEQNVDTIVMLTKLVEKGRAKCNKYWPKLNEPLYYGDLVVSIQSESNVSDYTIRIIEVKLGSKTLKMKHFHFLKWPDFGCPSRTWPVINFIAMKETRRLVRHFAYLKWPDMGCPDSPSLLLDFVKAVRQHSNDVRDRTGPTVVHCSAGVGRTGTFIAVDHLLQHIRDHDEVDIYNLVLSMRNQRCNMVQTEDQYVYIHDCLRDFITMDDEEDEDDMDDPVYENTNVNPENVYENTAFTRD